MAFGTNFYDSDAYDDFANLSRSQSNQSLSAGDRAASYADPFMEERKNQIERLRTLQSNPGSITTSPFYKFLMDTQMAAVNASNAARGLSRSGRGAMALQDRAAGVASQAYFPLLENASRLAVSGSNPGEGAGAAYIRGVERSQDQRQMGEAARAASRAPQPQQQPWWMQNSSARTGGGGGGGGSSLPSGGGGGSPLNWHESRGPLDPGYIMTANGYQYHTPSAGAGTGYISGSDGGYAEFSNTGQYGGGGITTNGTPLINTGDFGSSSGGYSGGYSDFGGAQPTYDYYADEGGYSDFGGGDSGGDYYGGE